MDVFLLYIYYSVVYFHSVGSDFVYCVSVSAIFSAVTQITSKTVWWYRGQIGTECLK